MPGIPLSHTPIEQPITSLNKTSSRVKRVVLVCSFLLVKIFFYAAFQLGNKSNCITNLKPTHSEFIGREQYLAFLEKNCMHRWGSTVPFTVLWGEVGAGKSEIAITFANKHKDDFNLIFLIDGSSEECYRTSYQLLAKKLDIPSNIKESHQEYVKRIHQFLEKNHHPWLLIFYNVGIYLELPQKGKGAVIITALNNHPWPNAQCMEVGPFTIEEASTFMTKITREEAGLYRSSLIQELGYYPMSLSIAAHYIADNPAMTEQKYLEFLTHNKKGLIDSCKNAAQLVSSWQITAQMLSEKHPKALEWLHFCTFLDPRGISFHWIEDWINEENSFLRKNHANSILRVLDSQALVRDDKNTKKMYLHRLKQEVMQQDQYFKLEMQDQVFQFLISHTHEPDWSIHATWFLNHYYQSLSNEKITLLQELIEKNIKEHPSD